MVKIVLVVLFCVDLNLNYTWTELKSILAANAMPDWAIVTQTAKSRENKWVLFFISLLDSSVSSRYY